MKRFIFGCLFLLFAGIATEETPLYAGKPLVAEAPFNAHGTSTCVSVATGTWTAIPTVATSGRVGLYVTLDPAAGSNAYLSFDNTAATTTFPILLKPGITQYHGAGDSQILYGVYLGASALNICTEAVKQ